MPYLQHTLKTRISEFDDIYCLELLQPLMGGFGCLDFTDSSFSPFSMLHIVNDIIANNRSNILILGSSLATVLIGKMIKKNGLDTRLLSVEHNKGWTLILNEVIQNEGISDCVDLIYAPLKESNLAAKGSLWYDVKVLNDQTARKQFDMVIIGGPSTSQKGCKCARYPALPYVFNKLRKQFGIYLSDANWSGEQSLFQQWEKENGMEFKVTGGTLAYYKTGDPCF